MKYINIYTKLLIVMITISLVSCAGDSPNDDKFESESTSGWIEFLKNDDGTISATEVNSDASSIQIPIVVNVPNYLQGLIINYDLVSVSGPNPSTIFSNNGQLQVKGSIIGKSNPYITIDISEASLIDDNMVFDIVLTGTNSPSILAGIENSNILRPTTHRVHICSTDLSAFIGTYNISEEFIAGLNQGGTLSGIFSESYQVDVSAVPGDTTGTKFIINNSTGFDTYYDDGTIITLNNQMVTFDAGDPMVALFRVHAINTSSYSECDRTLTLIGDLGTFGLYRTILTKQ